MTNRIWGVVLVGALLRLAGLGYGELWSDEAYSALLARESLGGILQELSRDSSPPLYYLLLHAWRALVGGDAVPLRALSALVGTTAIYFSYRLSTAVFNERVGTGAALLLAVSPLHIYYSQEARPYALLVLFGLSALVGLQRLIRGHVASGATLYCGATILALYAHNYGLFLLTPLGASVLSRQLPPRVAATCAAVIGTAYLPWVPVIVHQVESGAAQWTERIWRETPPSLGLFRSLAAFSIGGAVPAYVPLGTSNLPRWIHLIAYAVFGGLAVRALFSPLQPRTARRVAGLLVLLLGVPYVISFAVPIYVAGRYDVMALPVFLLLCAAGAEGLPRNQTIVAGALVLTLAAASLAAYYTREPLLGARRQASLLAANSGPADAVLAMGFTRNAVEYYVREAGGSMPFYSFPSSLGAHRGWVDERELASRDAATLDAGRVVRTLAAREPAGGRLWVVHSGLLGEAATLLLVRLDEAFVAVACPERAEAIGLSCWVERSESVR